MNFTKQEIIKELGLESADPKVQEALVNSVYETFNMRVAMALSDKITDEQLDTFNKMTQSSDDELASWVESNIPDYVRVMKSEMQAVLDEIKQTTAAMTKNL